jgi:hypothetical protein
LSSEALESKSHECQGVILDAVRLTKLEANAAKTSLGIPEVTNTGSRFFENIKFIIFRTEQRITMFYNGSEHHSRFVQNLKLSIVESEGMIPLK